ncbi:MAG: ABC transporter ATP-binding protein [Candidatus Sumerlaeota bacterium]
MIETKKLKKHFGPIEAVRGVSFRVQKGEVLGFLGPNGAGKTTVMRMLTCFLAPSSGTATVDGHDIIEDSLEVRKLIGYLPESNPVYGEMTTTGFLRFAGEMRGYRGKELAERVERVIKMCWLTDVRHQVVETLSKGFQRRVGLAQALIHDPPILILDEPTDGLDPNQKHEVRSLISQMAPEKAIIISTHILEEVEAVCSRAIIIAKGRIVADGTPEELKERSERHGAVRLALNTGDKELLGKAESALANLAGVAKVEKGDKAGSFVLMPAEKGKSPLDAISELVRNENWPVAELTVEKGDLNHVFRDITTKEALTA